MRTACLSSLPTWVPWAEGHRGDGVEAAPALSLTQVLAAAHAADLPPARSHGEREGESAPAVHPGTALAACSGGGRPPPAREAREGRGQRGRCSEVGGSPAQMGGGFRKLVGEAWHGTRWPWEWWLQEGLPPPACGGCV